jgi:hypothetical protein
MVNDLYRSADFSIVRFGAVAIGTWWAFVPTRGSLTNHELLSATLDRSMKSRCWAPIQQKSWPWLRDSKMELLRLCIVAVLLLAIPACDAGQSEHSRRTALDCLHDDQAICAVIIAAKSRLSDLPRQELQLHQFEQIALDVAAILRGMQESSRRPEPCLCHSPG